MSFWVNHLLGPSETEFPLEQLPSLFDELSNADAEHPDVSVTHESEWCLSVFFSGLLIWENLAGEGDPKHMRDVQKEKVLGLWSLLAQGNINKIDKENWLPGYGR